VAYSLFLAAGTRPLFVSHGEAVYEGMIIGIHSRDNDLVVNPIKTKKLTNIRAAGQGRRADPHAADRAHARVRRGVHRRRRSSVEVTPKSIRIRKRLLQEHERKRASRVEEALLA
jgi:GTP-binding protein